VKFNKDIAGFQLLSILSQVDGEFSPEEGAVIVEYIKDNFPLGSNLDDAINELGNLSEEDYLLFFEKAANDFLDDSNEKERIDFLKFAMKLIKVDEIIAKEEDKMISKLFAWWDI